MPIKKLYIRKLPLGKLPIRKPRVFRRLDPDAITGETMRLYWKELRRHKRLFVPILFILPSAIFLNSYASAWIVSHVINRVTTTTIPPDQLWSTFAPWIAAFIGAVLLGELVLWRLVLFLLWKTESSMVYALNRNSFDTLSTQSLDFHNNRFGGSLVSQVNKFSGAYLTLSSTIAFSLLPLVCSLVFTFLILGPQLPLFALGLAGLSAAFMLIAILSFRPIRKLNVTEAQSQTALSGQLADSITNIVAIKSHGSEEYEKARYDDLNRRAHHASLDVMHAIMRRDVGFGLVITAISSFSFIILIGGPSWFHAPIGTLVLAMTYSTQILGQLWGFNNILRATNRAFGDAQEMTKILGEAYAVVDRPHASKLKVKRGEITFDRVRYHYADAPADEPLFNNFSLTIAPGEQVGLVGQSGSGKTTLTKLLLRFVDIDEGIITIDGQAIDRVTQQSLRQAIAYVPQEPMLFHRTLRDNIGYGKPGATDKEIRAAAKKANAMEFIEKLPEGFDTMVGERGVKLSGGQRQRIAIARAILKDAPILVLDEATSALDSESEQLIQNAFERLMKGRTSIVIAHRLSTIAKLDRIVVLDHGAIAEQGSHDELIKKRGNYAKLWSHQSGGFIEE